MSDRKLTGEDILLKQLGSTGRTRSTFPIAFCLATFRGNTSRHLVKSKHFRVHNWFMQSEVFSPRVKKRFYQADPTAA